MRVIPRNSKVFIKSILALAVLFSITTPQLNSYAADSNQRVPRSIDVIPRPTDLRQGLVQVQYKGYFDDDTNWFSDARYNSSAIGTTNTPASGLPVLSGPSDAIGTTSYSWTGYFIPDFTGEWQFQISSDDASYMWLGNEAVTNYASSSRGALISNGGTHAEKTVSAKINLIKNKIYPLRIQYGDATYGAAIFKFKFMPPGFTTWQSDFSTLLWYSTTGCRNFGLSYSLAVELGYGDSGLSDFCKKLGYDPSNKSTWVTTKPEVRTPRELMEIPRPEGSLVGLHEARFAGYFADKPELLKGKAASQVGVRSTLPSFTNQAYESIGQNTYMWSGYLVPDVTGDWTFRINSDDASYMWLGNEAIQNWMDNLSGAEISNGGSHGPTVKTRTISLKKDSVYPFRILYGNWTSLGTFNFEVLPPDVGSYQSDTTGLFFHTPISYCTNWGISYLVVPKYGYDQVVPNSNCKEYKAQSEVKSPRPKTPTITSVRMTASGLSIKVSIGDIAVTSIYLTSPSIGYTSTSKLAGKVSGDAATFLIPISKLKNFSKIDFSVVSSNEQGASSTAKKAVPVVAPSASSKATPKATAKPPTSNSLRCSKGDKSRTFAGTVCPPGWSK
jgi:hypothetical protein